MIRSILSRLRWETRPAFLPKKMKRALLISLLLLAVLPAAAQRTAIGMRQLSLGVGTTLSHLGGELSFGTYLPYGYWLAEAGFHDRMERDAPSGEAVHFPRVTLRGAYMQRLLSTYSRSLVLYGGADAFLGLEHFDCFHTLSAPVLQGFRNKGFTDVRFIYGAAPRLEMEWFLFPWTALILRGRCPFTIGTPFPLIGWEITAGVKFNF